MAYLLVKNEKPAEAEAELRAALADEERLAEQHPEDPEYGEQVAGLAHNLGLLLRDQGRGEEARDLARKVAAQYALLEQRFPDIRRFREWRLIALENLSALLQTMGPPDELELVLKTMVERCKDLADDPATAREGRYKQGRAHQFLAQLYGSTARPEQEMGEYLEAARLLGDLPPDDPGQALRQRVALGSILANLALLYKNRGDDDAARDRMEQAIEHHRAVLAVEPGHKFCRGCLANTYKNYTNLLLRVGDHAAAFKAVRQEWELYEPHLVTGLACARVLGRCASVAEIDEALSETDRGAAVVRYIDAAQKILGVLVERVPADNPGKLNEMAWTLATIGRAELRDPDKAVELAGRAVELAQDDAGLKNTLGVALYRAGRWPEAAEALDTSVAAAGGTAHDFFVLAMVHWRMGHEDEAREWYARGTEWTKYRSADAELARFRSEAELLLGTGAGGIAAEARESQQIAESTSQANHFGVLVQSLLDAGDHAAAAAAAEEPPRLSPDRPEEYVRAAKRLFRCERLAAVDERLTADERQAASRAYVQRARELIEQGIRAHPEPAAAYAEFATSLVFTSDCVGSMALQAVETAQRAVDLQPRSARPRTLLGIACCHAGQWPPALEAFNKSIELGSGGGVHDWLFLAMAHWRLGNFALARAWHARAVEWLDANNPDDEPLRRYRVEADALLGIAHEQKAGESP